MLYAMAKCQSQLFILKMNWDLLQRAAWSSSKRGREKNTFEWAMNTLLLKTKAIVFFN